MLKSLSLQNFRNYAKREFKFSDATTLIVGPNASGKTNILEAIYALATGKSFRADKETDVIKSEEQVARAATDGLEIIWDDRGRFQKLYRVSGVGKRMVDFVGNLRVVLFSPTDIEIVANSPSTRRRYLDVVLSLVHKDYRLTAHIYERAIRQRNRLLWRIREKGVGREQLTYWDGLLTVNGAVIHQYRRDFLKFLSQGGLVLDYNHSIVSPERLGKYAAQEVAAATTLVGPQRDDFVVLQKGRRLRSFGSRGEQRLAIFAIKLGELRYVEKVTGEKPLLLLDDIFSELDHTNRHQLLKLIPQQQTIITTTDLHLVEKRYLDRVDIITLS